MINCIFCKVNLNEKPHSDKCLLNDQNVLKIIEFLQLGKTNITKLSKTNYNNTNGDIISPKALMSTLKTTNWNKTLIKLYLIYFEENQLDSIEEIDLLLQISTSNKFIKNYNELYELIIEQELDKFSLNVNQLNFTNQIKNLYFSVISRAIRDLIETREIDENKLPVNRQEAYQFLLDECPDVLVKLGYNLNQLD